MPPSTFVAAPPVEMQRRRGVHVLAPSPRRPGKRSPRHVYSRPQTVSGMGSARRAHALPPLEPSSWELALTTCPEQVVRR